MGILDQARGAFSGMLGSDAGQSVIGLDIGSSSIKVVQLKKVEEKVVLETYGALALGPYGGIALGQTPKLELAQVIEAVQMLLKESNVTTKTGSIAIPLGSTLLSLIQVPETDEKQLQKIIPYEAQKYIPVSMTDVSLDWWIMPRIDTGDDSEEGGEEKQKKMIEVLIAAIHNDVLKKYNTLIEQLGLRESTLEIEAFSAVRSTLPRDMSTFMIMDIGVSTTKLSVVERGIIKSTHILNSGSRNLTSALAQAKGVTDAKAEELKRAVGLSGEGEEQAISEAMKAAVLQLLEGANNVLLNYQKKHNRTITKIVMTGGGALLFGLPELARETLSSEVVYADSFGKVEFPPFIEKVLRDAGPEFAVAIGLALRRLQEL